MTRNHTYALSLIKMLDKGMDAEVIYNASNDSTTFVYGETETNMLCIGGLMDNKQALQRFSEIVQIIEKMKAESNDTV